ncbi:thioredoxin domain-containing protein 6 [Moniliophthora roreri MCA 2997]|uniref:Nucleoside diphosphate kinase n=2 Tax=Moniliophthora roreri TaxID=221103 RepID=V2XCB7_MONRO|nr:thioredoxin domain-containing protein 6 [Moniliophthora roreri MCA 2997]
MSASHSPTPAAPPYQNGSPSTPQHQLSPIPSQKTRTVAIIKNHALAHRLDIEPRIVEANFEIVKERQMEFDVESDPETLYELFGDDAESLGEGPVWVYVLERRRSVEVWNALMGNRDPEVARQEAPNSLRALYGVSLKQNALMGSPDAEMAEVQIASLFASSPPFPTTDLPEDRFNTLQSVSSSILSALRKSTTSEDGKWPSNVTSSSNQSGSAKLGPNGKTAFRARALPSTHNKPDIMPRTTRAADLRAGKAVSEKVLPRAPPTKEQTAKAFENVPGHKRAGTISVASTAAPTIAPRMTKAAALRLGIQPPTTERKKPSVADTERKGSFEGVPGHKRRETISVASVAAPTIVPRGNKSASLRLQKDSAPPSSFMFRGPSEPKLPGLSRSNSQASIGRPVSQASAQPPSRPGTATLPRRSSVAPSNTSRPASAMKMNSASSVTKVNGHNAPSTSSAAGSTASAKAEDKSKPRPRPSSVGAPTIAPRTNKSAALRAAKKEQEAAAAAAAAKKNARMSRGPPPSSMPKSLVV